MNIPNAISRTSFLTFVFRVFMMIDLARRVLKYGKSVKGLCEAFFLTDCLKLKYVRKNLMYVIVQQIKRYLLNLFIFYWREEGIIQTQLDHSIKVKILTI